MRLKATILMVMVVGCIVACDQLEMVTQDNSAPKIVGGKKAKPNQFPSVVKMVVQPENDEEEARICTGVIVSPRTIAAAAHCIKKRVKDSDETYYKISLEGVQQSILKADLAVTYGAALANEEIPENHVPLDLALIDFKDAPFSLPSFPKIGSQRPSKEDSVTLVGYGVTEFDAQDRLTGELHYGENNIQDSDAAQGTLLIKGTKNPGAQGFEGALAGPGDSGGPLFDGRGDIVGIGSALTIEGDDVTNYYVDLTSKESRILIERYLREVGGDDRLIPGFGPSITQEFDQVEARDSGSAKKVQTICGGGKKKKNKSKNSKKIVSKVSLRVSGENDSPLNVIKNKKVTTSIFLK